jgi:hypothetical protein
VKRRPTVLTVRQPEYLSAGLQILRSTNSGVTYWAQRRVNSGKVNVWPFSYARPLRGGRPFGGPLSEENQDRLEAARRAVYGDPDW